MHDLARMAEDHLDQLELLFSKEKLDKDFISNSVQALSSTKSDASRAGSDVSSQMSCSGVKVYIYTLQSNCSNVTSRRRR